MGIRVTLFPRILMTAAVDDYEFPCLFAHTVRVDWGIGVLAEETDGKRRYLFENGGERTLASGFHEMVRRVEKPTADQRTAYAKLRGVLAARTRHASGQPSDSTVGDQIARFHAAFSSGFADSRWVAEMRGEGAAKRLPRHRQPILQEAQERLSQRALDTLIENQNHGQVWEQAASLVAQSGLVSAPQLKRKLAAPEQQRALAISIRELLYGAGTYENRFDHFVLAFAEAFGERPRWELATALSALVHPNDHVCVDATLFRKQLKGASLRRTVGAQPSSSGYNSFLAVTRLVANALAEQGEVPRDLFDVRDFVAFTLKAEKAAPKAKVVREKAGVEKPQRFARETDDDDAEVEDRDAEGGED